jgi:hypothetical protein
MQLLTGGVVAFIAGVILIIAGRAIAAREARRHRGLGPETLDPFFKWFSDVLKHQWPILTGERRSVGERVTAAGSIVTALAIIAILAGILITTLQGVSPRVASDAPSVNSVSGATGANTIAGNHNL